MNKLIKVILSILGAVNVVFSIFVPIAVSLISIRFFGFDRLWSNLLLITGMLSSLYRAINVGFMKHE